jgi:hypothetical protein
MNPVTEDKQTPLKPAPVRLKRFLLGLLFICTIGGFIAGALSIRKTLIEFPALIDSKTKPTADKTGGFQALFEKAALSKPDSAPLYQGVIVGKEGQPMAVINGQATRSGTVTNGVRILEITENSLLIECNGETRRLRPGERLAPEPQ